MKASIDLHIHSCLSPCSEQEMTPNNIINMAILKGLDMIAITDHNSVENLAAFLSCGKDKNLVIVPGMELETREEIHLICLFETLEKAHEMQEKVYINLPDLQNREDIFGPQIITDDQDNEIGRVERMLITATKLTIDEVYSFVNSLGGVVIPAHVDRESYSILSNLGFIPDNLKFQYLEISKNCNLEDMIKKNPVLKDYQFIRSSDAHELGGILERESFIEVDSLDIKTLIKKLRGD